MLSEYFTHHHGQVQHAARQQLEAMQRLLQRGAQLRAGLQRALTERDSLAQDLRARREELRKAEEHAKQGWSRAEELEAEARREAARERKERKESEERKAEAERRLKATERKLTISDKKVLRMEEAAEQLQGTLTSLHAQLTAAAAAPASASPSAKPAAPFLSASASSSSSPPPVSSLQRELETLRVKLSFYESDAASLHALSLRDLSALADSLQDSLRKVREEQEMRKECKICLHEAASVVFLPCEHLVCCVRCSDGMRQTDCCPVCRQRIDRRIQTKS